MSSRGGYKDITNDDGSLVGIHTKMPKSPYDVIEELYGMIWWLADSLAFEEGQQTADFWVEKAEKLYREGLKRAPQRGKSNEDARRSSD